MARNDHDLREPFRARGRNVLLPQDLEKARAQETHHRGGEDDCQRHCRHDDVAQVIAGILHEGRVADCRQQPHLHREEDHQHHPEPETRNRESHRHEAGDGQVEPRVWAECGQNARGQGHEQRDDERQDRQFECRRKLLGDQPGHRVLGDVRDTEVPLQRVPDPDGIPLGNLSVEAHLVFQRRHELGVIRVHERTLPRHHRITGQEVQHKEHEERHDEEDGNALEQAADEVPPHPRCNLIWLRWQS